MNDADWFKEIQAIEDPIEMLKCIVENIGYYGHDPYYSEIKATIFDTAIKVLASNGITPNNEGGYS